MTNLNIDTSALTISERYRIKIGVENRVGETLSDSVGFLLAEVPSQPEPPTRVSDGNSLQILMTPPAFDGGSIIESYQLQIKTEKDLDWIVVLGPESVVNLSTIFEVGPEINLKAGEQLQARYRVRNSIGWSQYSKT